MAARTFPNEDEEAQHYLSLLRDGTSDDKIVARGRLAAIFSRRGLFEEAAELYEGNIRAGVRTPELFERLSETYRGLGDAASAEAALTEAQRLAGTRAAILPATPSPGVPVAALLAADPVVVAPPLGPPLPPDPPVIRPHGDPTSDTPLVVPAATVSSGGSGSDTDSPVGPTPAALAPVLHDDNPEDDTARRKARALRIVDESLEFGGPEDEGAVATSGIAAGRRTSKSGTPRPLAILAVLVFGAVVPIVLLAVIAINPLGLYLEGRAAGPTIDLRSERPPTIKIAPGMASTWYLLAGRSVSGLWATTGLDLALSERLAGAERPITVTAPRAPTWGETITIVERRGQGRANQGTSVPMTIEAPEALPPAGTVLAGRITGELTAPRLSESSQFTTTTERIDVPVQLVVVPDYDLWLDRFVNSVTMFFDEDRWLLVSIGAVLTWCVLAGAAALLFRARPA